MPNYQVISKETHASKRWKRYDSFAFAAQDTVVPIVGMELPHAVIHLPVGFIRQINDFIPVALLGFQPSKNLFVNSGGRWVAGYTPAAYRGYPFQLAISTEGQHVLVFDEESGLISNNEGEVFFDENGNPGASLKRVMDMLVNVESNRILTKRVCAALADHELIQPWPISLSDGSNENKVEGLFRIDEAAMNSLPMKAFDALRQAGALPIAYCQLLSMTHIQTLGKLSEAVQPKPRKASDELDLSFLNDSGTISF